MGRRTEQPSRGRKTCGVLIAQVTDTHITMDGPQADNLGAALAWINALQPRPDIVLLSGDLTNNGRLDQYARLRDVLARSAIDVAIVPGNHDRRSPLRTTLPAAYYPGCSGSSISYVIESSPVRIIALDTTAPGRPGGILDAARLTWLDACLGVGPDRPTLLFMHHPPFRTGVNLADMFGFPGLRAFERIVARHPQLQRVVAGHIHCERRSTIAQALVTTSISSTPQHVPEVFERHLVGLRPEPGGFALHAFTDGMFRSVTYVKAGAGRFVER